MKDFIKGRWFPFLLLLVGLVFVLLVGFLLGFRITYAPALENSWEAISGVAAWVGIVVSILSAIASFMAVWYAIRVADKQNQIALFEKRYECFQLFEQCVTLVRCATNLKNDLSVEEQCCYMLGIQKIESLNKFELERKIAKYEYAMHEMEFLFSGITEKDAKELFDSLSLYIQAIINKQNTEECKQRYVKAMIEFGKYADEIWGTMKLSI